MEAFAKFCSGSHQDFRKAGKLETLDEFRYATKSNTHDPNDSSGQLICLASTIVS